MITQLEQTQYDAVRSLVAGLRAFNVSIGGVLDGTASGTVLADDADAPQSVFMITPEGVFLAGNPDNEAFNQALNRHFQETIYDVDDEINSMYLLFDPAGWANRLAEVFAPRDLLTLPRRHYVCQALRVDWRALLPDGFAVQRIDGALLARTDLVMPEHAHGWIKWNWCTVDDYLERSFGFCTVRKNEVVSWSLCDGVSDGECEIGIRTLPDYRRRGLAAITAAAAVEYALSNGFTLVGWHCNKDNLGSIGVAEKAGFEKERDYVHHYFMLNAWDHWAEKGWQAFQAGRYQVTVDCYQAVFALRTDGPGYYFYLAARANARVGDNDLALEYLNTMADRGMRNEPGLVETEEFVPLRDTPAWADLLARVRANAARKQ